MADPGDHAFSLALFALGDAQAAEDVALASVRRGGRSRVAVLAFARHLSLDRSRAAAPTTPTAPPDDESVVATAVALAFTRPPLERVVVDLAGRHELDRARLARVLGLSAAAAGVRLASVADVWGRDLDPALLAWMGPGECEAMADVLDGVDRTSIDGLVGVASAVGAHVAGCEVCGDRARSMVTVQSLVSSRPLDMAPGAVRAAARRARFRPAAPLPPPVDPGRRAPWSRLALGAVAVLVVAAATLGVVVLRHRPTTRKQRVAVLTRVPGGGTALAVSPTVVRVSGGTILLRNTSGRTIKWHAGSTAAWLALDPSDGTLPDSGVAELTAKILSTAPEGDLQAPITVTGDDGSVAAAVMETTVEHPPTLAATIDGCDVKATAEDESAVASVVLHWRDPAQDDHTTPMTAGSDPTVFLGSIPTSGHVTGWWVAAVDSRGNRTQTQEQPPAACP